MRTRAAWVALLVLGVFLVDGEFWDEPGWATQYGGSDPSPISADVNSSVSEALSKAAAFFGTLLGFLLLFLLTRSKR